MPRLSRNVYFRSWSSASSLSNHLRSFRLRLRLSLILEETEATASTEHSRALDPLCDKEEGAGGERGRRDASQPLPELPCLRPQVLALLTDLRRRLRIDLLPVGAQSLASPRLPQHRSPRSPRALVNSNRSFLCCLRVSSCLIFFFFYHC